MQAQIAIHEQTWACRTLEAGRWEADVDAPWVGAGLAACCKQPTCHDCDLLRL